jgi:hypothetical protein
MFGIVCQQEKSGDMVNVIGLVTLRDNPMIFAVSDAASFGLGFWLKEWRQYLRD